jgi:methionine aminotransferase
MTEVTRVHQFVTFTVHTPSQVAFAEFVTRDPSAASLPAFYQEKRDRFLALTEGSPFRPLKCEGTYFQLMDYSAISGDADRAVAEWLLKTHAVAAIPVSAFLSGSEARSCGLPRRRRRARRWRAPPRRAADNH